jgi:hypothetical protein
MLPSVIIIIIIIIIMIIMIIMIMIIIIVIIIINNTQTHRKITASARTANAMSHNVLCNRDQA